MVEKMKPYILLLIPLIYPNFYQFGRCGTWADGLFDELNKDFGSVARGVVLQHGFRFRNSTKDVIGIFGVRSSCGCTTTQINKRYLQPGEEMQIQVRMDSGRFRGVKTVTLFVKIDRPENQEVRLWIKANSRDDISLNPEMVDFKTVQSSQGPSCKVEIKFFGFPQARIDECLAGSGYLEATVTEEKRNNLETVYWLNVSLSKQTPVGKWYSDIWITTNLPSSSKIRIPVKMEVIFPLVASPAKIDFGDIPIGKNADRRLILRGSNAFRILRIEGNHIDLTTKFLIDQIKPTQVLTFVINGKMAGRFNYKVKIITDLADGMELTVPIEGAFVP